MALTAERISDVLARYDARVAAFDAIAARRGAPPVETAVPKIAHGHDLSARELEVLDLVAKGLTTTEAARTLRISDETIKTHLMNLRHKLQARNRAHAVALACRRGLLA